MTTTDEYAIPADQWANREANCERMEALAHEFFDATTESANWFVTGWARSIVAGADVRSCREWLTCRAELHRLRAFHDLLTAERLIISSSGKAATTSFTPSSSEARRPT